jgi:hypothetical protein
MEPSSPKKCSCCGVLKERKEFNKKRKEKDGLQHNCRLCSRAILARRYREKLAEKGQTAKPYSSWDERQPRVVDGFGNLIEFDQGTVDKLRILLVNAKRRAREKHCPLDIDLHHVASLYVDKCPILGVELNWGKNTGVATPNSPSLDKVDPNLGYVRGNVWIISHRANTIKNNATPQELLAIANALLAR